MEDSFDFVIDFQHFTDIPMPEIHEIETTPQEAEFYVEIVENGKKGFKCNSPDCGKTFRYKSEAVRHLFIHQKDKPYCCTISGCKKTFKRPESLEEHIKNHDGELPFACDEPGCDRRFVSKPALRYHQLRHKNNREFNCDIEGCGKSFLTLAHLKQHQFSGIHNLKSSDVPEDKPYKIHKSEPEPIVSEPVAKPAEGIQWEFKSQRSKETSSEDKTQDMYGLLQNILAENQLLKQRLNEDKKIKEMPEKDAQYSFEYATPAMFSNVADPNNIFDSYESKIFEFLNEKCKSGF